MSAPCLVRVNTSTRSTGLGSEQSASSAGLSLVDEDDALLDVFDGRGLRRHRDPGRIAQHLAASLAISCGMVAEKNSVWRFRQHGDDALDVMDEAHVEHAVGFVEHQDLDLVEAHRALVDQIEQAAGRGHQDIDAVRQRARPAG